MLVYRPMEQRSVLAQCMLHTSECVIVSEFRGSLDAFLDKNQESYIQNLDIIEHIMQSFGKLQGWRQSYISWVIRSREAQPPFP